MPLIQTYTCRVCEQRVIVRHGAAVPLHCSQPMRWRQTREYKPEEHGWDTGMRSAAIGFRHTSPWEVPMQNADGSPVHIESLHELRQIERQTEQMELNGEGQAVRFRAFSQDRSNMQDNTFGPAPHRAPKLFDAQGRQRISVDCVEGDAADAEVLGDGTAESLMSALPESPL